MKAIVAFCALTAPALADDYTRARMRSDTGT